jgi:hypothetical protein
MSSAGKLVCLAGVSGAGKDTAGARLVERHGFERVAIADPMKAVMMTLFNLSPDDLWGASRNAVHPHLGRPPRELYQRFGRACVEIDPEVWLRPFCARVGAILKRGGRVVCTDLRTNEELDAARSLGSVVWLIRRSRAGAPGAMARDATETAMASADRSAFDEVIDNDGTLDALYARIERLLADPAS